MTTTHVRPTDIRELARLATQATLGITDLVEALHGTIVKPIGTAPARTRGISGLVYRSVRGVTRLVGGGLDLALSQLPAALDARESSLQRDAIVAALNGVLGDCLAASASPLATSMSLRRNDREFSIEPDAIGPKWLLSIHGLCMSDRQWRGAAFDHSAAVASAHDYVPLTLRYNSGRHISENGRELAQLLERAFVASPQPPQEIALLTHSMGGLVARSAVHYGTQAGHAWVGRLRRIAFLGTPHHGAALERGGNWIDLALGASRYSAPFARLGKIRSAGITDLRHGNVLDEHWRDQDRFARQRGARTALPLPVDVLCFALAASRSKPGAPRAAGDGLVSVASALGRGHGLHELAIPADRQWIGYAMNHMELLRRAEVAEQLVRFFARSQ